MSIYGEGNIRVYKRILMKGEESMVKERYRGVEYYKGPDLAKGHMLNQAKEIYEELAIDHSIVNVNEALELYNIIKYVKDGTFLLYLGEDKEE